MAQVTDSLLAEFQARVDRGEHINSTVNEEAQLLHAFRERASLQKSLDMLYGVRFSDRCYHALKSRAERGEEYAGLSTNALRDVSAIIADVIPPHDTPIGEWQRKRLMEAKEIIRAALAASPKDQRGAVSDGNSDNAADSLRKREGGRNDIGPTINGRSEEPLGNQHVGGDAPYPAGSPVTASVSLGASEPSTPTIPEGCALVPKEPTGPMWVAGELEARAGRYETERSLAGSIWRAMLAAAPSAPVSVSGEGIPK